MEFKNVKLIEYRLEYWLSETNWGVDGSEIPKTILSLREYTSNWSFEEGK